MKLTLNICRGAFGNVHEWEMCLNKFPSLLGIVSVFLSWLNHLQNLGAACGGAARSESPAGELCRLAPAASPGPRPVLRGCPGADREEDKKERAGPSGPARCRTVPFCADCTRTPSLRAEDHLGGSGKATGWEMQCRKCPALRAEGERSVLAPEVLLPAASLLAPSERREPSPGLVLRCYLEDGASKGAWLNRSSIIFAGSDKWSVDPRVSIATANRREYSLQIQDVDVTDDGPYTCSVQTQHTPRTMQVHLTVQVSPKIFRISSDIIVNEGSNVTLVCLATGKPEPSISWRHISPSAKPFENGQYLDIYGITRDQAGEYECSAENDVSVPDVKKVKVTVNFAPTIQELKSSGVMLGGNGLIRCEGAGVPAPVFEWYRGERKLINGQQGITIKNYSTRSLLTVTNVTEEHFGNYTCVAANKLGTTNASLPLNPPSTAQYGITGDAEVLFSCWYLVLTLSSLTSIFYLKNIILH
uniref:Neuronal growth regulator 1 n=1 Tax=Anser cygnoides TaxID=8845 RepID=A0A8B9EFJ9_ANSCY